MTYESGGERKRLLGPKRVSCCHLPPFAFTGRVRLRFDPEISSRFGVVEIIELMFIRHRYNHQMRPHPTNPQALGAVYTRGRVWNVALPDVCCMLCTFQCLASYKCGNSARFVWSKDAGRQSCFYPGLSAPTCGSCHPDRRDRSTRANALLQSLVCNS